MVNVDSLPAAQKIAFRRKTIHVMADLTNLALLMSRAQDFSRAKDNFFIPSQKLWFMFGGTIKRLDASLGQDIEILFNSIKATFDQSVPNPDQLVDDLSQLDQHMATAVQVSDAGI